MSAPRSWRTLAQLTVRAVPEADLAYCQVSVFTGSRSARLGYSLLSIELKSYVLDLKSFAGGI